jgi:hypothetical protein
VTDHPILVFLKASVVPVVDPSHCGGRGGGNDSRALRRFVNENTNQSTNVYQSRTPRAGPATVDPHAITLNWPLASQPLPGVPTPHPVLMAHHFQGA